MSSSGILARAAVLACLAVPLGLTSTAAAQSATVRAEADAAHEAGKRLLGQKKLGEACAMFERSHELDPGVGNLLFLATCYEWDGKLASAWLSYREAAALATKRKQRELAGKAAQAIARLEPRLPWLTVTVAPATAGLTGLVITRDGEPLGPTSLGLAIAIDPGEHEVGASAEGHEAWRQPLRIAEGESRSVVVPELAASRPSLAAPTTTDAAAPARRPTAGARLEPSPRALDLAPGRQAPRPEARGLAYGLAGLGVALLVTSGYLAWKVGDYKDRARDTGALGGQQCDADFATCGPAGLELLDSARRAQTGAIVAASAAGVAGIGAAIAWLRGGPAEGSRRVVVRAAMLGGGPAALLVGRF